MEDGLLLLSHVSLAMFPVKVSDDGSSEDQAGQQRQIKGATVAILHLGWSSLLGIGNDLWRSSGSRLSGGGNNRSGSSRGSLGRWGRRGR